MKTLIIFLLLTVASFSQIKVSWDIDQTVQESLQVMERGLLQDENKR